VNRAGSWVDFIVPKKKTGPNAPMTTAVTFNQSLCVADVMERAPPRALPVGDAPALAPGP
jgi:hypothetical protein